MDKIICHNTQIKSGRNKGITYARSRHYARTFILQGGHSRNQLYKREKDKLSIGAQYK